MSWLKKIGTILLKASEIAVGFGPVVSQLYPGAAPVVSRVEGTIDQLVSIIVTGETMGQALGLPGPDKARAMGPLIAQEFLKVYALGGKQPKDAGAFLAGATTVAGGIADMLNAFEG